MLHTCTEYVFFCNVMYVSIHSSATLSKPVLIVIIKKVLLIIHFGGFWSCKTTRWMSPFDLHVFMEMQMPIKDVR